MQLSVILKPTILVFLFAIQFQNAFGQVEIINFEKPNEAIEIDTSNPENLWVIAQPSKILFDSAHSGINAMITDSSVVYDTNSISRFILGFNLEGSSPSVMFKHKINTDKNRDGGFVELLNPVDSNWIHLSDTTNATNTTFNSIFGFSSINLYSPFDILYNGKSGFSGTDTTWTTSRINFDCLAVKKSFWYYLRFTFISDSIQTNKEGWIIDDIVIQNNGECTGIDENKSASELNIYPNPISSISTVDLSNSNSEGSMFIMYNLLGETVFEQIIDFHNSIELNADDLVPGVHFYTLLKRNKSILEQGKLIIQ